MFLQGILSELQSELKKSPPKKNILIVEDDLFLETFISRVLKFIDPHFQLEWVSTVEDALCRIYDRESKPGRQYDLILADIVLDSKHTGLDLWDICQEKKISTPMLLMSGMPADAFLRAVGSRKECPPFIQKPFSIKECQEMIHDVLWPNSIDPFRLM